MSNTKQLESIDIEIVKLQQEREDKLQERRTFLSGIDREIAGMTEEGLKLLGKKEYILSLEKEEKKK